VKQYLLYKKNSFKFIYVDEFGINTHLNENKGWSKRGIKIKPPNNIAKSCNLSVLFAITDNKILN